MFLRTQLLRTYKERWMKILPRDASTYNNVVPGGYVCNTLAINIPGLYGCVCFVIYSIMYAA